MPTEGSVREKLQNRLVAGREMWASTPWWFKSLTGLVMFSLAFWLGQISKDATPEMALAQERLVRSNQSLSKARELLRNLTELAEPSGRQKFSAFETQLLDLFRQAKGLGKRADGHSQAAELETATAQRHLHQTGSAILRMLIMVGIPALACIITGVLGWWLGRRRNPYLAEAIFYIDDVVRQASETLSRLRGKPITQAAAWLQMAHEKLGDVRRHLGAMHPPTIQAQIMPPPTVVTSSPPWMDDEEPIWDGEIGWFEMDELLSGDEKSNESPRQENDTARC